MSSRWCRRGSESGVQYGSLRVLSGVLRPRLSAAGPLLAAFVLGQTEERSPFRIYAQYLADLVLCDPEAYHHGGISFSLLALAAVLLGCGALGVKGACLRSFLREDVGAVALGHLAPKDSAVAEALRTVHQVWSWGPRKTDFKVDRKQDAGEGRIDVGLKLDSVSVGVSSPTHFLTPCCNRVWPFHLTSIRLSPTSIQLQLAITKRSPDISRHHQASEEIFPYPKSFKSA